MTTQAQAPRYTDRRRDFLAAHFERGLDYDAYVATAGDAHRGRWDEVLAGMTLTGRQRELLGSFTRTMNVLVLSGSWCGDCIRQVPVLRRIEEACPPLRLRILDRDENPELRDELRIAGAMKVPVTVFLSEDFFECERFGDRTLATYRRMAATQLGPACPIGPAPLEGGEQEAMVAEWVEHVERVHLMLRLSPFLRERHGD